MSLKKRLEAVEALIKPKATIKFILSIYEMTDEPNIVWVLFEL